MPYIPKKTLAKEFAAKKRQRELKAKRAVVYNTDQWKFLRLVQLQKQPLCECCLMGWEDGKPKVTAAAHVHHLVTPFGEFTNMEIAFDERNLSSLCAQCHNKKIHGAHKEEQFKLDLLTWRKELLNNLWEK